MEARSSRPVLIAALALAAAVIACIGGAPTGAPTEAAQFATLTPGGRISVSLLTPTSPAEDVPAQGGTPIGPVATSTAEAASTLEQTQSAPAATPTTPGVFAPAAECPAPGNPRLPAEPPAFNRFAETIVQYLSGGGAPTVLEGRLAAWGTFTSYGGFIRADRDLTGDGVPEVLAVLMNPHEQEFPFPGDLFIFGCERGAYRLLYQAGSAPNRSAPIILNVENNDVNANRLNDLVYAVQTCDDRICSTSVEVIEWSLTLNSFGSLLAQRIDEPFAAVEVADLEGDGLSEIVVERGAVASEAAGPQRSRTTTLRWDGAQYAIAEVDVADAEYRIHVLHDGDTAMRAGDYASAAEFYARAATDDALQSWRYPDEASHLRAYARFRLMLAEAAQGNTAEAQAAHDELIAAYTLVPTGEITPVPGTAPALNRGLAGSAFAEMAQIFWREYTASGDTGRACSAVTGYARTAPSSYEVLNSFGYANPTYTAADLCPFGG